MYFADGYAIIFQTFFLPYKFNLNLENKKVEFGALKMPSGFKKLNSWNKMSIANKS